MFCQCVSGIKEVIHFTKVLQKKNIKQNIIYNDFDVFFYKNSDNTFDNLEYKFLLYFIREKQFFWVVTSIFSDQIFP